MKHNLIWWQDMTLTVDIADLEEANLEETNFTGADFTKVYLKGTKNLTVDQLPKAKTLYMAQLDEELEADLRAKGFGHL